MAHGEQNSGSSGATTTTTNAASSVGGASATGVGGTTTAVNAPGAKSVHVTLNGVGGGSPPADAAGKGHTWPDLIKPLIPIVLILLLIVIVGLIALAVRFAPRINPVCIENETKFCVWRDGHQGRQVCILQPDGLETKWSECAPIASVNPVPPPPPPPSASAAPPPSASAAPPLPPASASAAQSPSSVPPVPSTTAANFLPKPAPTTYPTSYNHASPLPQERQEPPILGPTSEPAPAAPSPDRCAGLQLRNFNSWPYDECKQKRLDEYKRYLDREIEAGIGVTPISK